LATLARALCSPGKALHNVINILNFKYEDDIKIYDKYFPAIFRILYLSSETISRPPQSHATIPLKGKNADLC
jgi:hypothetical protein